MNKRIYLIRREDIFKLNNLPDNCYLHFGSIWVEVVLTAEQAKDYPFPISLM